MHPHGGAVGEGLAHAETVGPFDRLRDRGEAEAASDVPQGRGVGGVEHHLVRAELGVGITRDGVDQLHAVEEGELVALLPIGVVGDEGLAELRQRGGGRDGEATQLEAAHEDARAVEAEADAGEAALGDLVRCQHAAAVFAHALGDEDLDHAEVSLNEGVVGGHVGWQFLEAALEHVVEELVGGAEVGPLGAGAHLFVGAAGVALTCGSLVDDGAVLLRLDEDVLAHLAAEFGVDSK